MNHYLVKLRLFIGMYEKHSIHAVAAETEQQAELEALQWESHGSGGFDDDGDWWDCGEMMYRIDHVKPITLEEYTTYNKLISSYVT